MGADDVGTPLHRDMGVHITRGVEPWRIFAQYMGRADGPTQGRDGNVHMADQRLGCSPWSATCRRCCRSPLAAVSRSASARRSASRSPGQARVRWRAATRTRG
jgi:Pyruvate/2-oxoglutarate dehydrogenase complex, dehydrogenase (E1) component, eukaryotic type, alpha subunit